MIKDNRSAIMQPTYLPWAGYFGLISSVDLFVFLDDVQITLPSWQNRNRILTQNGPLFLTLPASVKGAETKLIRDIVLPNQRQIKVKHLESLRHNYRKAPFFEPVYSVLHDIYSRNHNFISEFNIDIIKTFSMALGYKTEFLISSELKMPGTRSEKLINILEFLKSEIYCSPIGSREYIEQDGLFLRERISVFYQDYEVEPYPQLHRGFTPYLSAVDLFFCLGFEESAKLIFRNQSYAK
jgi:hypothetical protein